MLKTVHVADCLGQVRIGRNDEPSDAEAGQRRQQRVDATEAAVERWICRKAFERFGRLTVEQDHAGDLFRIAAREDPHVLRARRVSDEHERTRDARAIQQVVQFRRDGHTVLRSGSRIAPAAACTVVHAHSRVTRDRGRNPSPISAGLA
jgi:hypothetical protein